MRQSKLFTKTRKTFPKDEVAKNAQLLIKGGFVHKELAGVYSYLPLGLRVLKKVEQIIREEMNNIGGQELLLSTLQEKQLWEKTNRWEFKEDDIWFKLKLRSNNELGLAFTHEEPLINIMTHHISSYNDLPCYVYQFQTKFRQELRAKSGLLRGFEFVMKDLYSFCKNEDELKEFHEKCADAYWKIFERTGIKEFTYRTFASGGVFSKFSDEFQTTTDFGEDTIYVLDQKTDKKTAVNAEIADTYFKENGIDKEKLTKRKAIEVGNIFKLGSGYANSLGLEYLDKNGNKRPVVMGSYGIGLGRLMATIVEVLSDDRGIVWPESVAPFQVHLIELENGLGEDLYEKLQKKGIEVLYDDRDSTAGEKFNDADLIGIPWRFVVSEKTKGKVECKKRSEDKTEVISYDKAIRKFL